MKKEEFYDAIADLELDESVKNTIYNKVNALSGKDITALKDEKTKLENEIKEKEDEISNYKEKIASLDEASGNAEKISQELEKLKKEIADREASEKEANSKAQLEEALKMVIGDKEFVNDFTKNAIIKQVQDEMSKPENSLKGVKEIFNTMTKDADGIFKSKHVPAEMSSSNKTVLDRGDIMSKEQFDKAGYKTRVEFKANYPEIYAEYTNKI